MLSVCGSGLTFCFAYKIISISSVCCSPGAGRGLLCWLCENPGELQACMSIGVRQLGRLADRHTMACCQQNCTRLSKMLHTFERGDSAAAVPTPLLLSCTHDEPENHQSNSQSPGEPSACWLVKCGWNGAAVLAARAPPAAAAAGAHRVAAHWVRGCCCCPRCPAETPNQAAGCAGLPESGK